jgi:hypothetical protein
MNETLEAIRVAREDMADRDNKLVMTLLKFIFILLFNCAILSIIVNLAVNGRK